MSGLYFITNTTYYMIIEDQRLYNYTIISSGLYVSTLLSSKPVRGGAVGWGT